MEVLFLAKDEYTFTFLKGSTQSTGGGAAKTKSQAGDSSMKDLRRTLEKIFRESSKDNSNTLAKSLEKIIIKFAKIQTQVKGTAASAGLSGADARRIAKEVASEIVNQQIRQLAKSFPSKTTTTKQSDDKLIKSIERSADRQAKTIIGGLNSILSRHGVQLENIKDLERAISGAVKNAIPKDTSMGIKEIGRAVTSLKSGFNEINKLSRQIMSMRKSGGGIDVKEIKEMMSSFQKLNKDFKQITDSTVKAGKAIESVTNDVVGFKKSLSEVKKAATSKVRGVRERAEADPSKFAKTAAVAIGQTLERALQKSPGFKGSDLERNIKKLGDNVKDIGDVLDKFKKVQADITTSTKKGKISIDTKAIIGLSKDLGNLPDKIGVDIDTKGWKDLTKGLENFAKTADFIISSLKKLKVSVDVDTKPIEKKVESAVKSGVEKGFSNNIKAIMKEADTSFNKVISEMRVMYKALPKESPIRSRFEKAGKALTVAKERGDYLEIAKRITGIQDVVKAPVLNKAINELKGVIVEITSELKGAGVDDVSGALKKSGKAVDELTNTILKKKKEIDQFPAKKFNISGAMDKVKFLQSTSRQFPQEYIKPGKEFELKGTDIGFGANVRQAVKEKADSLAKSLGALEQDLISGLEAGPGFQKGGWKLLDKELKRVGQQWTLQMAQIGGEEGIEGLLKQLDKTYIKIKDPKKLLAEYKSKRKEKITNVVKEDSKRATEVGKWLIQRNEDDIEKLSLSKPMAGTIKKSLKTIKSKFKGTEVGEIMRSELISSLGTSLEEVFKETFAADLVKKELATDRGIKGPLVRRMAIPAAKLSETGTATFKTRYGTERALPKFATYKTGFEELYDKMTKQQAMVGEEARKFQNAIIDIGMKPTSPKAFSKAKDVSKDMLTRMAKTGPQQLDFVIEQYKEAATMIGAKRQQAGVGSIESYEKKISSGINSFRNKYTDLPEVFDKFVVEMEDLGLSAYDVVKSLESIKFENVYDIYRKVLKGKVYKGKGGKKDVFEGPTPEVSQYPGSRRNLRRFDQAVAQVEQLMPIIEKAKVKRGKHQEEVTTTFFQTSPMYKGSEKELKFDADKQKDKILSINMNLRDMLKEYETLSQSGAEMSMQTAKRLERYAGVPRGVKTISTLGPPEEQASKYTEFRGGKFAEKARSLAPLESTAIKLYTEKLLDQAPFGEFSRLGKQIGYVNSAMSSLSDDAKKVFSVAGITTEEPKFRTTRERELTSAGRYGSTGYGFNVIAELKHSADTFEDQVVVSGNLAKALTQAVSTLVKPGPKGRLGSMAGAHVTDIEKGQVLRDTTVKEIGKVSKQFMEILGVPQEYKKEADKALIETVKKEIINVRGQDVEIQKAQLAEVFMNYFGRKFTTRYGSKGVSISKEDLGTAKIPKSMGQLASDIIGKMEEEGKAPKFGKLKNIAGIQKELVESGNKFMISMFSDATSQVAKGLGVEEEIEKQAKIYKMFTGLIKRVYGEDLPKDVEGILKLKSLYKQKVGGKLFEEKPIDIRISARGAIKRGLQPEFIETMMGNVIGAGAKETTVQPRIEKGVYEKILGTKGKAGMLSRYSKALGFESAGPKKKEIEKELFKTFKAAGKTDEEAKVMAERAAAFEASANYYTTVKNEYGKATKSIIGPKFVQIIEEPHETEKWSAKGVKELKKGAKINLAAYSAYAGVFGEQSSLMKQIKGGTTLESKKQFEYIKALEAMAVKGPGKEMADALMQGVRKVPLGELQEFEPRTGTFSKEDLERSLKGTVLDIEKYASDFAVDLPAGKGAKGEMLTKPFYIPGPLARQTYPEELLAGEYGMDEIARYLQMVINTAKETEAAFSGEGSKVKDVNKVIRDKVLSAIAKAQEGGVTEKTDVLNKLWQGLQDIEVDFAFRKEMGAPEGTTEKQYITKYFEKFKSRYAQTPGKTEEDAMLQTIRRMGDILVGPKLGARKDIAATKPRLAKEVEAGTTAAFAKRLGIDITDDEFIDKKLDQLRRAKVTYMSALAKSLLGKSGAVQSTFFERKAPAVMGKAINAVTDRTSELKEFSNTLRKLASEAGFEKYIEAFGSIANVVDEIGAEHANIISKYKKSGVPVLKQEELGIPESMAKKMPVTFEKRYEMTSGMPILTNKPKAATTVESNLSKMLDYKKELEEGLSKVDIKSDVNAIKDFIEQELVPHVETMRFPFTGVSSLQPYKAKVLKEEDYPKGKFAYAVPGVPEMRMATEGDKTGFVEVVKKLEGIRDDFIKAREGLHTTSEAAGMEADPSRVKELTDKIGMLDEAISNVLPRYTAIQQKLDFDGDEIEAHSGVLAGARRDIKKHFDTLNKSTDSIETAWRQVRGFEETTPGATSSRFPFADLLTYFESKWKPEKGYEFLKRPEITEKLEFLKPSEKLDILSGGEPQKIGMLLKDITSRQVTESGPREEIFATIDKNINEGNNTSKALLEAIKMLDSDFSKLIEAGVNESLYQQKYSDAIIGQLYKLHTGPDVEAVYRMQRVSESRMGFGGGMIAPEEGGYRTNVSDTFRKRWPTGLKMLGKVSPESEISTFMNEISRFAQQKGMDVKLAGEKPVGGEMTSLLGKGTEGMDILLEKIGLAGEKANDDYKQLKEFADTSSKVIEKRLGTLPTEAIKKEVSGLRKVRGMPEITMGTRKQAVDEAVKLIGFEGFLRELSKQIEEDAVEALTAQLEAMPEHKRKKRMSRKSYLSTKEFAEEEIQTSEKIGKKSPTGISTSKIMQQRAPLYGFRSSSATQDDIVKAYRDTAEPVVAPKYLKGDTALKYEKAQEVALSIARSLKEVGQMRPGGAYSDLVLSTIDNMYKEQAKKESTLNDLRQEGYNIGIKRETSDIPQRMFEEGMPDIPSFIRELIDPSNTAANSLQELKKEVDALSLLAGVPPLSAETRKQIKIDMPELGAAARAKYPEIVEESEIAKSERESKISEFTDLLIQKAQAVAQMDRAIASLISSKGFETKLLPPKEDVKRALNETIKATIKAPIGRPTIVEPSTTRELRQGIEKASDMFFSKTQEVSRMPVVGGPTGPSDIGPSGTLAGRLSDEVVRVHIQSVQEGIGLSFTPAGAMQDVIESRKPDRKGYTDELKELQRRSAGVTQTLEETYANVYRASALSGGGIYGSKKGSREQQQVESIKEYMRTGKKEVPPKAEAMAFEGTVIHKKEQDRLIKEIEAQTGGKEKYDVERYVKYTSSMAKDITGHVDLIKQRLDEDTQEYVDNKIIDIKTVSDKMVKRFKDLGVEKFSDLPELKKKGGLTEYDVQKLEDVASQLNLYIAAVAQANSVAADSLKGEAWFYDRDDIKNIAKVSFDFDPNRLKKDIDAVSKARKSIVSEYGKDAFAKATHVIDLEKADAKRKAGVEPLSTKEWKRFENISKEHRKMVEDPSSDYWKREKDVKPRSIDKERLREEKGSQRARFESYTIPEAPVMGEAVYDQLENLKLVHKAAKDYQLRSKGINMKTVGTDIHESLAPIIENVQEIGPQGNAFSEAIEDLKFAGMIGGGEISKAWKYYRIALGDFYIKQAEEAKKLESDLQQQGELGGANEAYQQAERTINDMKKRMSQSLGKPSDIYTEMRRYISPDIMQQLGLYLTPEQLITKSKGSLGDDEKLDKIFKEGIVGDVLEGGKLTAPIEKVRDALKGISDLDEDMVKVLTDANKLKKVGPEIQEAWNFEKLTDRVTKLRASLETFLRFRLQEDDDVVGRKNLEDTLKLLKSLENQYSSLGRVQKEGPAGWGQMGLVKVPKFVEPKQQYAMHMRNVQKTREYFGKIEEKGGPKAGERYSYMFKVIGESGDTIKNAVYDFRKYGDAVNFAGEKVGVFKEDQRDMFEFMQEGGRTFRSAIMRAIRWGAASRIVYGGWQKLGQSIGLLADIETGMANLRMVMSPLETDFGGLGKSAIGFAKQYGVPMTDVLKSMKIFAQQGLKQEEVVDRTQTATLASNVTTLSATEATEALTAAMKVFRQEGESSMKFMDAWSEVEAKHAITSGDMANALKKAASAGKNAGFSFDELNGVVAAIGAVTRQSGKEVGTAMRFIFRRLTSEKGPKELAKIGIPVLTDTGELRKGFDVLDDLSKSWKDLTSAQRMNIAQAIGGTRQYNALLVLMDNWGEALSAIKDSTNSKGSAERRNLEIMKTFTKQMAQMKQAATEVYMSFGKITFPAAKVGLKGLKFLLEAFTEVPGVIKGAMIAISGFFIYMSKGADIIDYFFERWRGGKSIIGNVMKEIGNEWTMGMSEMFGTGALEQNLKTIGKGKKIKIPVGVFDVSPKGVAQERVVERSVPQGKKLGDFHSVLGKTTFLLKQTGMAYNDFIGDVIKGSGDLAKDMGGPFEYISKKMYALESMFKKLTSTMVNPEMIITALETGGFVDLIPGIIGTVGIVASKATGDATKAVSKLSDFAGDKFGQTGKSFVEGFASGNTDMVKALAPLGATIIALYPALKSLSEYYMKTTQSAQDYEKAMYGVRRANESQLKGIRELMSGYSGLESSMADVAKVSDPNVKKRRQELGTFESPLLTMSSIIKKSRDLSNNLADSNINLVVGYDKFGNAILNVTGNLKDYLKTLENIKVKEVAKVEIDIAAKFITDLTEIEGPEKWKYALKNLLKEAPAFGEVLAKGIKTSPAKAMNVVTERLNDMLALKKKFPMSTAFDKDINKHQANLKKVRSGFSATYSDFRRVLSDITTKGLGKDEIAALLGTKELRKGYELMIEVEPRFNLKETKGKVEWQDVLGAEVMRRAFPSFAATFDATSVLTKARLETSGAVKREGKAMSGDVAFFMDSAADKYGIAGNQAVVSLKETTDGVFDWFITYFNSKTLKIEEKPFTEDLQGMVESIFPKNRIEEELSERVQSLNEFVAGASAGLRGLSAKDFKKDFGLGERFFSEIPTTTILQGPKGFVPSAAGGAGTFGQSPFQKDWKETTEQFFFKPMREYRLKADQLDKLKLEGLQGGEVTLAKGLYEELTKLQNTLKNNQVVLQYRAVFADLTKTLEEGTRALKENLAIEKSRLKLRKGVAGYQKGIPEGLDDIDLGVQKFSDLTVKQRALMAGPEYGKSAIRFRELETRKGAGEEQVYGIDRALVALENIRQVSKGFGTSLSPEDMKKYTEIIAKTDDTGAQSIAIETSKVVDNTASTVDRLDQILENMGDVSVLEKQLENIGKMSPSSMVSMMEKVARVREKKLETGDKESVRATNKTLDVLVNSLVEQVGIKKAMSMVDNSFTLFSKRFKPEEFTQRAFGGLDFKQFTTSMKENLPTQRSFFKRFLGIGENISGFDKEIKPLVKLQDKNNKEQWVSSKEMIKLSAAMAVWSSFNKHQSSRVIKELEGQKKEYKVGSKERVAIEKAIEKERTSGIMEGRGGENVWKLAQSFSFLTGTVGMFAKELGMTERQIKTLGGASAGLYAGLKLASKITGDKLPESAKKFEASLKEAALTGKKGPLITASAELAKDAKKMFKKTGAISEEEYKKTATDKDFKQFKDALDSAVTKQGDMSDKVGDFLSKARSPKVVDERFLTKILTTYLAATAAGYAAQRTEDETRLATLNSQAEKEAKLFVEIVEKYPKAAQKMIDARKELVDNIEKVKPVPTTEKSLVMDTEKEREKIVGDLSKIRKDIISEHEKMNSELSKVAKEMAKLEIAEKFKIELEEMERAIKDIDIASATQRVLETSLSGFTGGSVFGGGTIRRDLGTQWSGDVSNMIEDRFEDMSNTLRFPKSAGKLVGKYKPQSVDYGIRGISEMTPEQYMVHTGKRVAYKPSLGQFFGQEVSGPQRGEMGIVTLLKDVLSGKTLGISKVRTAEDMFSNLENMQKKREVTEAKFIEHMSRREELRGRKGKLSETESAELDKLDNIIESLGDGLVSMVEDIAKAKDALKTSLEEAADVIRQRVTAFDALRDLNESNINRMYGNTAVVNRGLAGFGGGYDLPMGKREMSLQQRIFTDATSGFNERTNEYAYKLNTLIPSMSQNISELTQMREDVPVGDTDRYNELTKQIEKSKSAMDKMIESTRSMGEALFVANKFAEVMYKFKDAIEDIQINETVEGLSGFKGFRESMDKVFGGAHPLAPVQVSPEEERRAAQVGIELKDLRSTQFDKMEAESRYKLRYGGLKGKDYREATQQYLDIPELKARAEEAYKQRQEVSQLQRQAAPFEEILKMLQRLSVSETITPERRGEVIAMRDSIANAIDGFGDIMTQQQKLDELEKNKGMFSKEEYTQVKKSIEEGAPEQYKGLQAFSQTGLMKEFGAELQKMMQVTPKPDDLENIFGKSLGDVTSRQDTQIKILTQIAQKGFGLSPEDMGIVSPKDIDKSGVFETIIRTLRSVGSVWDKKAGGGRIFGAGGPREDKVPAMLSPGEYVVRAASAQKLGYGALEHMNQKGEVPGFAEGGRAKRFKIDQQFGTIEYTAYEKSEVKEEKKKEELVAKELMKKTKIGKTLSDRQKRLKEALGYAGGGAVETLRSMGMSEEDIKRELGGLEEPLLGPGDIIGMAAGVGKLALGLGKTVVKQIVKKPKTYEELLKPGTKDVIDFIKNRLAEPGDLVTESKAARDALSSGRGDFLRRQGLLPSKKFSNIKKELPEFTGFADGGKVSSEEVYGFIKEAGRKHNLDPELLRRMVGVESDFDPRAVSKKSAIGLAQVLLSTAQGMGYKGDAEGLKDPRTSIMYGAQYLRQMLDRFGSIELALAAYNAGPYAVEKHGGIPPYKETKKHIPKVLKGYKGPVIFPEERKTGAMGAPKKLKPAAATTGTMGAPSKTGRMGRGLNIPVKDKVRYFTDEGEVDKELYEATLHGGSAQHRTDGYEPILEGKSVTGFKRTGTWDVEGEKEWEGRQLVALEERSKKTIKALNAGVYDYDVGTPLIVPEKKIQLEKWVDDKESMDWINSVVEARRKERQEIIKSYQSGGLITGIDKEEEERLYKGFGPRMYGRETSKRVQDTFRTDALAKAKQRVSEATADTFEPKIGETKRITPGKASDIEFRGYKIPTPISKAGKDQIYGGTITPGPKVKGELYELRRMQEKLKFIVGNKEEVYKQKGYNEEQKEQFDKYIGSQNNEINDLVSKIQTGQKLSDNRAWDPEYKRSYFPDVEKYHSLKEGFTFPEGIYSTIKNKQLIEKYKGFEKLNVLPSDPHKKIIGLINEGKKKEAKELYDDMLKTRKTFSDQDLRRFDSMSFGDRRKKSDDELAKLRLLTEATRIKTLAELTGRDPNTGTLDILRKLFPEAKTDDEIYRLLKNKNELFIKERVDKAGLSEKTAAENKHHGGEIKKTGNVFMQKGEMVYPKAFAMGGPVYGELAKEATTQSLNSMMEIRLDATALNNAISKLQTLELKIEDKKLEIVELPKIEVDTGNVNLVVNGDEAAAKIRAAVEDITIDVNSTGAVGAEELKNVSDQLENRINSLNVNVEDLQNNFKIISSAGENIDINGLLNAKINEYTSDINRDISEVKSDMSNLESKISQNQNRVNVVATELDRKIMHLQNLTGRGI